MASDTQELPDSGNLIDDFEWATTKAKLCANRVWSVARKDLPKLLPSRDKLEDHVKSMQPASEKRDNSADFEPGADSQCNHGSCQSGDGGSCNVHFRCLQILAERLHRV
jgi:hypothetical protein